MLDTIKVAIPLGRIQHRRIHKIGGNLDTWTWAFINQASNEQIIKKFKAIAQTDQESFHREIRFDYPPKWIDGAELIIEFSVPKFWYGHNIFMLYDWPKALRHFRNLFNKQFKLGAYKLPKIETWKVLRADACYVYKFPTQELAQSYLDSLKRHSFPRRETTIYPSSIHIPGQEYTFKIYLKLPEFMTHDRKALLKQNVHLEWIDYLENEASGVLRVEAGMRRRHLKKHGLETVGDLMKPRSYCEWDSAFKDASQEQIAVSMMGITQYTLAQEQKIKNGWVSTTRATSLTDGRYYHAPPMIIDIGGTTFEHPGGGFTYHHKPILLDRLRQIMHRFLGGPKGMDTIDKIQAILLNYYKPVIAAKLVSFWLYVQQFGSAKAKTDFGKRSYYYQRRQLKKAGVGLIEIDENLIKVDPEFFRKFKLDIPSEYVHKRTDEFRDSSNLLNLTQKQNQEIG